jgi:hypothetical protein
MCQHEAGIAVAGMPQHFVEDAVVSGSKPAFERDVEPVPNHADILDQGPTAATLVGALLGGAVQANGTSAVLVHRTAVASLGLAVAAGAAVGLMAALGVGMATGIAGPWESDHAVEFAVDLEAAVGMAGWLAAALGMVAGVGVELADIVHHSVVGGVETGTDVVHIASHIAVAAVEPGIGIAGHLEFGYAVGLDEEFGLELEEGFELDFE